MMTSKILIISAAILLWSSSSHAQKKQAIREIGIERTTSSNYGLVYRLGNETRLFRLGGTTLNYNNQKEENRRNHSLGLGLRAGIEWRKLDFEKLELRVGGDLGYNFFRSRQETIGSSSFSSYWEEYRNNTYGLYLLSGINYIISDFLVLGATVQPALTWTSNRTFDSQGDEQSSGRFGGSFDPTRVNLSLVYRIHKKSPKQ